MDSHRWDWGKGEAKKLTEKKEEEGKDKKAKGRTNRKINRKKALMNKKEGDVERKQNGKDRKTEKEKCYEEPLLKKEQKEMKFQERGRMNRKSQQM